MPFLLCDVMIIRLESKQSQAGDLNGPTTPTKEQRRISR